MARSATYKGLHVLCMQRRGTTFCFKFLSFFFEGERERENMKLGERRGELGRVEGNIFKHTV